MRGIGQGLRGRLQLCFAAAALLGGISISPEAAIASVMAPQASSGAASAPALGCAPSPSAPHSNGLERDLTRFAGRYLTEDGSEVVVTLVEGVLKLASGPMTFTLVPCSDGKFGTRERELSIAFAADAVTVSEQGRIVARAVRGTAGPTTIMPQGAALPQWLDRNVPLLLARYRVPAAAVAYIRDGRIVLTRVYGERRRGEAAKADTLFNIASLSKPITAEVLLRLASANQLDLDARMHPDWVDPDLANDPRARQLTVRMALQHRTGLPNWRAHTGNVLSFVAEPGTMFRYSGEGYTYAGRYAERRTGKKFEDLAQRLVLGPAGMPDTSYTIRESFKTRAAYPHDTQGRELTPHLRLDFSGACCVHTTIGDYARFVRSVMEGQGLTPAVADQRFALPTDQRHEMCGNEGIAIADCPTQIGMALGWMIFRYPNETVITHTGVNDGERSAVFLVPERKMGVVILTNGANGAKLIRDITAAAYDNPKYLRIVEAAAK